MTASAEYLRQLDMTRRRAARGRARGGARAACIPTTVERVPRRSRRARRAGAVRGRVPARHARRRDARAPRAGRARARRGRPAAAAARQRPGRHRPARGRAGAGRRRAAEREAAARERRIADELQRSLLPQRSLRRRAPRGRDLLPGGRRGHAGRRRLVRRDRARRGPHRARDRRRHGPRRARRRGDGPAARGGARVRAARPRARRRARVPRRRRRASSATSRSSPACTRSTTRATARSIYANAGHLPPLLRDRGRGRRGGWTGAAGPPLGRGPARRSPSEHATLAGGALLALYTDGLVERRDARDRRGIDALAARSGRPRGRSSSRTRWSARCCPRARRRRRACCRPACSTAPPQAAATLPIERRHAPCATRARS